MIGSNFKSYVLLLSYPRCSNRVCHGFGKRFKCQKDSREELLVQQSCCQTWTMQYQGHPGEKGEKPISGVGGEREGNEWECVSP